MGAQHLEGTKSATRRWLAMTKQVCMTRYDQFVMTGNSIAEFLNSVEFGETCDLNSTLGMIWIFIGTDDMILGLRFGVIRENNTKVRLEV